jgi:hypothetical protein
MERCKYQDDTDIDHQSFPEPRALSKEQHVDDDDDGDQCDNVETPS